MDTDDVAPPPEAPKPLDLEVMSIEELTARIEELEAEIVRIKEMIAKKQVVRGAAESVFRA